MCARYKRELKRATFEAYGGCRCACCGETEFLFLTLDHIENDGMAERLRLFGSKYRGGHEFYISLKKRGYPPGYQVLCMNCNFGKRMNQGICPHTKKS